MVKKSTLFAGLEERILDRKNKRMKENSKYLHWENLTIEGQPIAGKYQPIVGILMDVKESKIKPGKDGKNFESIPIILKGEDGKEKELSVSSEDLQRALLEAEGRGLVIGKKIKITREDKKTQSGYVKGCYGVEILE